MNTDRNVLMASDGRVLSLPTDGVALPLGSGPHCRVTRTPQGFQLDVLVEATVNGQEIRKKILQEGDVVLTDGQRFTFTAAAAPAKTTARVTQRTTATQGPAKAEPVRTTTRATATGNTQRTTAARPAGAGNTARTTRTTATNTTRTTAPTGTGNTSRMAAGNGTSKMAAGPAGPAGPATSRTTRMTQRTTSRVTTRTTGMFPAGEAQRKRFKRNMIIAGSAVAGLALIGGVLLYLNASKDNPEAIKKELAAEIEKINALPEDELGKKLQIVIQLLNEEKYRLYGGEMYKNLLRQKPLLEEASRRQRDADADVAPYMQELEAARAAGAETLSAKANDFYDRVKALIEKHGTSRYGPKLQAARTELLAILDGDKGPGWQVERLTLRRQVLELSEAGNFTEAHKVIDAFGEKHKEGNVPALAAELTEIRGQQVGRMDDFLKKLERNVKQLREEGKSDDAKRMLEDARAGFKGNGEGIREGSMKLEDLIGKYR